MITGQDNFCSVHRNVRERILADHSDGVQNLPGYCISNRDDRIVFCDEVDPRRSFIQANALSVANLHI